MASVEEVMVALRDCWCAQLGDSVATCCLTSSKPVIVECCAGFGWVRLIGAYPSVAFPVPYNKADRCRIDTWAISVEVGIARCAPEQCGVVGETCCVTELDAALAGMDDFTRARRLFSCCLPSGGIVRADEIIPGDWRVGEPEGTCVVSTMKATLFVSDSCSC